MSIEHTTRSVCMHVSNTNLETCFAHIVKICKTDVFIVTLKKQIWTPMKYKYIKVNMNLYGWCLTLSPQNLVTLETDSKLKRSLKMNDTFTYRRQCHYKSKGT